MWIPGARARRSGRPCIITSPLCSAANTCCTFQKNIQTAHMCAILHNCVGAVLCRLLRLIAIGLQLPENHFDPFFDAAISNIRTIRYLPGQHRARDGVFGVGARVVRLHKAQQFSILSLVSALRTWGSRSKQSPSTPSAPVDSW